MQHLAASVAIFFLFCFALNLSSTFSLLTVHFARRHGAFYMSGKEGRRWLFASPRECNPSEENTLLLAFYLANVNNGNFIEKFSIKKKKMFFLLKY